MGCECIGNAIFEPEATPASESNGISVDSSGPFTLQSMIPTISPSLTTTKLSESSFKQLLVMFVMNSLISSSLIPSATLLDSVLIKHLNSNSRIASKSLVDAHRIETSEKDILAHQIELSEWQFCCAASGTHQAILVLCKTACCVDFDANTVTLIRVWSPWTWEPKAQAYSVALGARAPTFQKLG